MTLDVRMRIALGSLRAEIELAARPGETLVVVGPNGAGKTTCLRAIAGLQPVDEGRISLGGETLEDTAAGVRLAPELRSIGFVFQDDRLLPHLTALDNVAFGLRARGASKSQARADAQRWLDRFGVAAHAASRPSELSGGEAQRVALARALATSPRCLLLDEPLASIDASARGQLRRWLVGHLREFAGPRLVVTHDPLEAVVLADRLVVVEGGRVVQGGTVAEVCGRPRSAYVADLVGQNLFRGRAHGERIEIAGDAALVSATRCASPPESS
ncbi:MAG TPA: ABC transporter ATP-binding protein, partial [Planctomycetota bacterium]|nr:ABC transporter ATP-binding protein [Planctomycetota bacterium]